MYDDNAWPETASINTFIPERRRPAQVFVAAMALLAAAVFGILVGVLYPTVSTPASNFLLTLPGAVSIITALVMAAWLGIVAMAMLKGRKWVAAPALWTAVALLAGCGIFGAVANPKVSTMTSAGYGWFYAVLAFATALSGAVALVCLLGRNVKEYFDPPAQPSPFTQQQGEGMPPISGYDADWTPPQQRQQPPQGGYQQQPPYGPGR